MKVVVVGGSGLIGKKLVPILRERGHEAVPASPSSGVNALTGEGLAEAFAGAGARADDRVIGCRRELRGAQHPAVGPGRCARHHRDRRSR